MPLYRDDGFLGTHVTGKCGQYCGVRCTEYDNKYYVFEGDRAQGYRLLSVDDEIVKEARKENTYDDIIYYIEEHAAAEFYYWDGERYVRYHSEKFRDIGDEDLYDKVIRTFPETAHFISAYKNQNCTAEMKEKEKMMKREHHLCKSQLEGVSDLLWSMAAMSITNDPERLKVWFNDRIMAFGYRSPMKILEVDGENILFAYFQTLPL